jgi:hypothetical protein
MRRWQACTAWSLRQTVWVPRHASSLDPMDSVPWNAASVRGATYREPRLPEHGRHHVAEGGPRLGWAQWAQWPINSTRPSQCGTSLAPSRPTFVRARPSFPAVCQMLAALKNVLARPRFKALPPVICWTPPSLDHALDIASAHTSSRRGDAHLSNCLQTSRLTHRIVASTFALSPMPV